MPRPGPRLPMVGVRFDPTDVDDEAARETQLQGRPVTRSEMVKTLIAEALTARQKRRERRR